MCLIIRPSFLAHLSQRLIVELIVYTCSGVRRHGGCCPPFSNVFSSETAWPIKAKFYVEPPWEGGTKVNIKFPFKRKACQFYGGSCCRQVSTVVSLVVW